ncbi:ATPase [Spirochaetia bacterium]|nr:ATPase [Spirochaetia bacterium]
MKARRIAPWIQKHAVGKTGRILVFTGARQTGKTTLTRQIFPDYHYLSIEDPVSRAQYERLNAEQWKTLYPRAILDEVQKAPSLVESIQSVYDQWEEPRYILLGSSQLLLLEKVRESLAGRCTIVELFPLTVPELRTDGWHDTVRDSVFQQCLLHPDKLPDFLPSFVLDPDMARKQCVWDFYLRYGGYPALTDAELDDEKRVQWLRDYVRTYLERDIRDLTTFRDLEPFVKLQIYLAQQTGLTINASTMAVQLGVSVKTVQRYIRYFELSYQALILPAWSRNMNKRLTKAPKLHYLDNGVLQAVLQKHGGTTGAEFESVVVAELYKQIRTLCIDAKLYHVRTHDGAEIDVLLELPFGYFAFEIKMSEKVRTIDAKHFKMLDDMLDKPFLHGFVLSNDRDTEQFADNITALNAAYFLG